MKTKIYKSKDQNGIILYGAIINDIIISTIYTNKIELKNRISEVKNLINNKDYSNFIKII